MGRGAARRGAAPGQGGKAVGVGGWAQLGTAGSPSGAKPALIRCWICRRWFRDGVYVCDFGGFRVCFGFFPKL